MSKIKNIEISDFRIYEGKEEFNFEGENGTSNLVALYAPNGFGKTSFFDAIEWSFSNEIKRFENNFIKKAIKDEQEDTILLTNTNSYKKGLKGKVKITTDKQSFLEKTVQKYKKPGTLFYNDYRQGLLSTGGITKDLSEIPDTNILTQDQIDTFLRFKTPEEKFAALKEFWPQSEDATNKLKQLSELHKVILNSFTTLESKLKEYKHNLKNINSDEKNITQINLWLQKLKELKGYKVNISIDKIDKTISHVNYTVIYDENLKNIKGIALEINKEELIKSELHNLKEKYDNYVSDNNTIEYLDKKNTKLKNRRANFLNLKKSKSIEKTQSTEIEILNLRIENYKYINIHIEDYLSDLKKLEHYNFIDKLLLNLNTKLLDDIQIIKQSVFNFKQYEMKFTENRIDKENQQSGVDKQYLEFEIHNKAITEQNKELLKLNTKISDKDLEIRELQKSNQIFDEIIEKEDYSNTVLSENKKAKEFCDNLIINTHRVNYLKSDISLKQKELDKSGTLNENLDKIILFGEGYITTTHTSECPLCKTSFESFEKLIEKIKLDKKDTLKITEQKNEISRLSNQLSDFLKYRADLITSIDDIILFEKGEISRKIIKSQEDKNEFGNKVSDINNKIRNLEYELKNCNDFFSDIFKNAVVIDKEKIEILKKKLLEEIILLIRKQDRLKKIIKTKEDILFEKENNYNLNKSKIDKNKNNVELIQTQNVFQKINSILTKYKISNTQLQKSLIEKIIVTDEKESLSKVENLDNVSKDLKLLEEVIRNDEIQIDESNLDGNIFETESQIKSVKEAIEEFKTKFNRYITSEEINEKIIDEHRSMNLEILGNLLIVEKDLNGFGMDLELIKENIKQNELVKEIEVLKHQLPRIKKSCQKIEAAKKDCMSFVQSGINNYFNKDVINEVYSRIEPHPKLTKIDFSTDFNDKGEPRLLITTGNEEGKVNPVLFLSAGQVNVLSLSIFLAKAFEYGNETIETIFMDDPIQNLSDINVLSFIDLLRTLISTHDKQIVISTHDEKFFRLLQNKLPEEYCNTKYFEFESEGKLKKNKTEQNV
jgi:DNA repair exonuclease SbcCD ATPase subunit